MPRRKLTQAGPRYCIAPPVSGRILGPGRGWLRPRRRSIGRGIEGGSAGWVDAVTAGIGRGSVRRRPPVVGRERRRPAAGRAARRVHRSPHRQEPWPAVARADAAPPRCRLRRQPSEPVRRLRDCPVESLARSPAAPGRRAAPPHTGRARCARRVATNLPPGATRSTCMRRRCSPTRRSRKRARDSTGQSRRSSHRLGRLPPQATPRRRSVCSGDCRPRLLAMRRPVDSPRCSPRRRPPSFPTHHWWPTTYPSRGRSLRSQRRPSQRCRPDNAPYDTSHQLWTAGEAEAARDPAQDRPRPFGGAIQ